MQFEGKDEALEREAARNVVQLNDRPERGKRKKNAVAAKAEAQRNGVDFEFDGKQYHLPPADEWDIDVMEHFSDGDVLKAAKALFEEEQWEAFRTDENGKRKKRVNRELAEFIETAMSALGVEPGESNS